MRTLSLLALLVFAGCLDEQTDTASAAVGEPSAEHDCPPPPQEAIDACAASTAGATCSFDHDDHHIEGTCRSPSPDLPLACAPKPPQEALDACAASTAGASCSFEHDGHEVNGTCKQPSADVPLACAPALKH
jgi:hypothetical protein